MAAAFEGAGAEVKQRMGQALDLEGWQERVKALEAQNLELIQTLSKVEEAKKELEARAGKLEKELADKTELSEELDSKLKSAIKDAKLQGDSLAATEKALESIQQESSSRDEQMGGAISDLQGKLTEALGINESLKKRIDELEAQVVTFESEIKTITEKFEAELQEGKEERAGYKERMNEAIQERWLAEEAKEKMEKEMDKLINGGPGGGGLSMASRESEMSALKESEHELKRKVQDLEGEVKRAKLDSQEQHRQMSDLKALLTQREFENNDLNDEFKKLTQEIMELGKDLTISEQYIEKLEEELETLKGGE
jgi:chromosome segregation ATPase